MGRGKDSKWAWFSVLACAASFFVTGGISRSFSLLYQSYVSVFPVRSALQTATVAALFGAVKLCSSPLVSWLCKKYTLRSVAFVGALVAVLGTALSSYPVSLEYIYVTHGLITAIGTNMIVTPSFILIGRNFGAGKAKAMSWMTVGACLGGIAYPPLVARGLRSLGYTTTMACMAVSCLIYVLASAGYLDFSGDNEEGGRGESAGAIEAGQMDAEDMKNDVDEEEGGYSRCVTDGDGRDSRRGGVDDALKDELAPQVNIDVAAEHEDSYKSNEESNLSGYGEHDDLANIIKPTQHVKTSEVSPDKEIQIPAHASCPEIHHVECQICKSVLMRNSDFLVFLSLMTTSFLSMSVSNTFLAAIAVENGINPIQVASILSLSSAINIPSRLVTGVLFDSTPSYRGIVFACIALACGVWACLIPVADSVTQLAVYCIMHCFFGSSLHSQHITVLSDIVEKHHTTKAIGICRLFQGFGLIIGPFLGGGLADYQNSYKTIFYASGGIFSLNSFLFLLYFSFKIIRSR